MPHFTPFSYYVGSGLSARVWPRSPRLHRWGAAAGNIELATHGNCSSGRADGRSSYRGISAEKEKRISQPLVEGAAPRSFPSVVFPSRVVIEIDPAARGIVADTSAVASDEQVEPAKD